MGDLLCIGDDAIFFGRQVRAGGYIISGKSIVTLGNREDTNGLSGNGAVAFTIPLNWAWRSFAGENHYGSVAGDMFGTGCAGRINFRCIFSGYSGDGVADLAVSLPKQASTAINPARCTSSR